MPPAIDHGAAADDHTRNGAVARTREDVDVEGGRRRETGQGRMCGVEHHEVRARALGECADRAPARRRTTRHRAERQRRPDVRVGERRADVPATRRQALRVLEHPQFLGCVHGDVAVGAHAPAAVAPAREIEDAVAEVRFGRGAQAGDGAGGGGAGGLVVVHMRGVHQAPAGVHRCVVEQPRHRALTAPRHAVFDLARLLRHVHVHGRGGVDRRQPGQRVAHRLGRHRAQGMQREAHAHGVAVVIAQRPRDLEQRVGPGDEAALAVGGRGAAEAALLIQHRQQREANAGALRGADDDTRQRRAVGVGPAIDVVVQVVELADRRVAGLEHLDEEIRRNRVEIFRRDRIGHAVHPVAPAPEAVIRRAAELGQPGKRPLKRVRVQVRHPGQHRPGRASHAGSLAPARMGSDPSYAAGGVPLDEDVARPARGQQRVNRVQGSGRHVSRSSADEGRVSSRT